MKEKLQPKVGRPRGAKTFDPAPALAFGAIVRRIRLKKAISQEELANLANVERSHMGKIERGEHLPNLILILKIANALSISAAKLIERTEKQLIETNY